MEWADGQNTNPLDGPTSYIDYSYTKVKRMLQEGSLPIGWLKRVKAIIHLKADISVRFELNRLRSIPTSEHPEAIERGTAFWLKDEKVLRFYGLDDFSEMRGPLQATGVPIYTLSNDGGGSFYINLELITDELFVLDMPAVGKLLSGIATFTKSSFTYMLELYMLSLLRHAKSTKQQQRSPSSTETSSLMEEAASVLASQSK